MIRWPAAPSMSDSTVRAATTPSRPSLMSLSPRFTGRQIRPVHVTVNLDQYNQYVTMDRDWISAEEAMDRLGVRSQTLYAYVSRGRIEARPDPVDPRRSRYRLADVGGLAERKKRGRKASEVAAGAIAWGEPVLASAITTVAGGRLFYRGRDAVDLSA